MTLHLAHAEWWHNRFDEPLAMCFLPQNSMNFSSQSSSSSSHHRRGYRTRSSGEGQTESRPQDEQESIHFASLEADGAPQRLVKAPGAPKRFKSAFIFYSTWKHGEIRKQLNRDGRIEKMVNVAKVVSESWRNLPPTERKVWEEKARLDKERYELEKSRYKGPWKVRAPPKARTTTATLSSSSSSSTTTTTTSTTTRQQGVPKKPLSAYLSFSNKNRLLARQQYPNASNGQISRILASMWREAPEAVKAPFLEEETRLRQEYKDWIAAQREQAVLATSAAAVAQQQQPLPLQLPYAMPTTKTTNRPATVAQMDVSDTVARWGVGKDHDDDTDTDTDAFFEGIVQEFSILHKLDELQHHEQDAHHHQEKAVFPLAGDAWTMGLQAQQMHGAERAETTTRGAPTAQTCAITATEERFLEDDLTDDEGVMTMMMMLDEEEDANELDDAIF